MSTGSQASSGTGWFPLVLSDVQIQNQHPLKEMLVRRDIDVNEHETLSNITLKHKLK